MFLQKQVTGGQQCDRSVVLSQRILACFGLPMTEAAQGRCLLTEGLGLLQQIRIISKKGLYLLEYGYIPLL